MYGAWLLKGNKYSAYGLILIILWVCLKRLLPLSPEAIITMPGYNTFRKKGGKWEALEVTSTTY